MIDVIFGMALVVITALSMLGMAFMAYAAIWIYHHSTKQ